MAQFVTGNTGRSTGPHLDFRVYNPSTSKYENPSAYTSRLSVGGNPFDYRVTSGFGPRNAPTAGASTDHKGIDYATPVGTTIDIEGGKHMSTFKDPGGGGIMSQYLINTDDGPRELLFLHGSDGNKITAEGALTEYDPSTYFQDSDAAPATVAGDTTPDKAQDFLASKTEPVKQMVKREASDVVEGFGNDFGSMKSSRLGDALRGAQEDIVKTRMAGGEDFGKMMKAIKK